MYTYLLRNTNNVFETTICTYKTRAAAAHDAQHWVCAEFGYTAYVVIPCNSVSTTSAYANVGAA